MRSREDTYDSKRLTKRVQPLRVQRRPSRFLSTDPDVRFCHLVQIRADSFWRARHVGHARWDSDLDRGVEILLSHTKHNSEIFFSALSFRMPYDGLSQWNSSNKHTNYHTEALRGSNWLKHQCYKTKVSQHIYIVPIIFFISFLKLTAGWHWGIVVCRRIRDYWFDVMLRFLLKDCYLGVIRAYSAI